MGNNNYDLSCALGNLIFFFSCRGIELSPINVEDGKKEYRIDAEKVHKSALPGTINEITISRIANEIREKSSGNITFGLDEKEGKYVLRENA